MTTCKHCGEEIDYISGKEKGSKIWYHRSFKNFRCGKMVYWDTSAEPKS